MDSPDASKTRPSRRQDLIFFYFFFRFFRFLRFFRPSARASSLQPPTLQPRASSLEPRVSTNLQSPSLEARASSLKPRASSSSLQAPACSLEPPASSRASSLEPRVSSLEPGLSCLRFLTLSSDHSGSRAFPAPPETSLDQPDTSCTHLQHSKPTKIIHARVSRAIASQDLSQRSEATILKT
jgi:hypothetical protein